MSKQGQLKKSYDQMRELIIEATSLIEALIDFGEDAEIDQGVFQLGTFDSSSFPCLPVSPFSTGLPVSIAQIKIGTLRDIIARRLNDERRGEIIRSGIQLAIIGAPNAGKSSLLNWLGKCRDTSWTCSNMQSTDPHNLCFPNPTQPKEKQLL